MLPGQHLNRCPGLDVYAQLYRLAGLTPPEGHRTKPACCDTAGEPSQWAELCDDIIDHARTIARRR